MPYIKKQDREHYDDLIFALRQQVLASTNLSTRASLAGQLNYIITSLILSTYSQDAKESQQPLTYADYNAIIGLLESAKLEMYRRQVSVYEDIKIVENGDV
jgi:hypothetical protein